VENGAYRRLRIGGDDAEIVLGRPVLSGSVPFPIARGAQRDGEGAGYPGDAVILPANGAGREGEGARPAAFAPGRARLVWLGLETLGIAASVASFAQAAGRSRTRGLAAVAGRSGNAVISQSFPEVAGAVRRAVNCRSITDGMSPWELATLSAGSAHDLRANAELLVRGALPCYT
jgi:hypothetical protein